MSSLQVFIGYDPREGEAGKVLVESIKRYNKDARINYIDLAECRANGLYTRPTVKRNGRLYDVISDAPMATEFALSRFLVPTLADPMEGRYALFMDIDMIARCDLDNILDVITPGYPVYCVKHDIDHGTGIKMDNCIQTSYPRKNWSSVMLFDLEHKANSRLSIEMVNKAKGLDLHQFCWLFNDEIGGLDPSWNHLVGVQCESPEPNIVHYTLGTPNMAGYEHCEHSEEWWELCEEVK